MKTIVSHAMALGAAALAASAASAATRVEPNHDQYVSTDPVFSADLPGRNAFTGVLDPETNELCYILNAPGVERPTAAHIHAGGPGENGAPVLTLETPADGSSNACVAIPADLARALIANPGGYYVNIHNAAYPAGAVRGQLRG